MRNASGKVNLAVQLKREIGKLWDDISKAPYKELFNPTISGLYIWRCVLVQRKIDEALDQIKNNEKLSGRDYGIAIHGNRLIALLVFNKLHPSKFNKPEFDINGLLSGPDIANFTNDYFDKLRKFIEKNYSNAIIPTLFKNLSKCRSLYESCQQRKYKTSE
ncbi:MAG: hypothetical protein P4L50_00515 [Anaerolineaceae bacterium]|nr:hypothetical protein [Anaerolineaceae bacterium]